MSRFLTWAGTDFARRMAVAAGICAAISSPAIGADEAASAPRGASGSGGPSIAETNAIESMLTLDERETIILAAVRDGISQLYERGLYVLLARAERLPRLSDQEFDKLNRPSYDNLMRRPGLFRGDLERGRPHRTILPIRMKLRVHRVTKVYPGREPGFAGCWDKDKPLWWLDCTAGPDPLSVFSIVEPTVLGEPDRIDFSGAKEFVAGRPVEVAAVFYKLLKARDREDRERIYPVLIAWQIREGIPDGAGATGKMFLDPGTVLIVGLLVVLVAGFYLLKRFTKKPRPSPGELLRRPQRDGGVSDAATGEVDPLLKSAVQEYRKEKQGDETPNGKS